MITGILAGISLCILVNNYKKTNFLEILGLVFWETIFVLIGIIISYKII